MVERLCKIEGKESGHLGDREEECQKRKEREKPVSGGVWAVGGEEAGQHFKIRKTRVICAGGCFMGPLPWGRKNLPRSQILVCVDLLGVEME